jgi:hypothetical protein
MRAPQWNGSMPGDEPFRLDLVPGWPVGPELYVKMKKEESTYRIENVCQVKFLSRESRVDDSCHQAFKKNRGAMAERASKEHIEGRVKEGKDRKMSKVNLQRKKCNYVGLAEKSGTS